MSVSNNIDRMAVQKEIEGLIERYNKYKEMNLKLDMSRGKPGGDQLDLSMELLNDVNLVKNYISKGNDYRNYGFVDGIPEMKQFFADVLEASVDEIIVGGNSSLNMMYDVISRSMLKGNVDGDMPWSKLDNVKFFCPSPGYDRHFAMCEYLGIEMITIDMTPDGPDMDTIEKLVAEDSSIRGMWSVPKYSNPDGITYSDDVCRRLASMKTAAPDFRIYWDNSYVVHHLNENHDVLLNILDECKKAGNPNRPIIFTSMSKITFPGAGISAIASSVDNVDFHKKGISMMTIGPDKLNQLRHINAIPDLDALGNHMNKHAELLRPKFDIVFNVLEKELKGYEVASWNVPNGGYFISLFTKKGCAKDSVQLAKEAGVTITPAGATYPYGKDPSDRNIRIAPTYPSKEELGLAIEILCVCIKIVTLKKALNN